MNALTQQAAKALNVNPSQVIRVEEWATVMFAVVKGIGARFISKKAFQTPATRVLTANTRRQERNLWVALITGTDARYTFAREFVKPERIEWGKNGMRYAEYELLYPGFYQDADGDYFEVVETATGLDTRECSYAEVKYAFYYAVAA